MAIPFDVDQTWNDSATVSLNAGELRRADTAMFAGAGSALGIAGGITRHGDSSLSVSVDGSDVVTIQPGAASIPGNAVAGTGCYRFGLSAAITGSLAARNATNPRITLVVARAMDDDVVGTHDAYTGRFSFIDGTPAASPAVPTLPSMAVELARITVPQTGGGAASVDLSHRTYATAVGGTLRVPTFARLPVSAATADRAVALDTLVEYRWTGSAWDPRDAQMTQAGHVTITVGTSTSDTTQAVVFPTAFSSTPEVIVSQAQGNSGFYFAGSDSASTTGFTAHASKTGTTGSTTIRVNWIAYGPR